MNWWGKLIGGTLGFVLGGGPLGALLGAAIGHTFDKGLGNIENLTGADQEQIQAAFFAATFSIMGRLAKADGRPAAGHRGHRKAAGDPVHPPGDPGSGPSQGAARTRPRRDRL